MSLYEELGVPKDATPDEIRKAFLEKAKEHHPDKEGGDEGAFKRVNNAYMVLRDPEKRERYDRTGAEHTASPEEREIAKALEMASGFFQQLFTMAEFDPALHDPLVAVKKLAKMERSAAAKRQAQLEAVLDKMRKTIKRLKKKGKEAKAERLERVLEQLTRSCANELEKMQFEQRVCDRVLEMLKGHTYELDAPPAAPPAPNMANVDPEIAAALAAFRSTMNARKAGL